MTSSSYTQRRSDINNVNDSEVINKVDIILSNNSYDDDDGSSNDDKLITPKNAIFNTDMDDNNNNTRRNSSCSPTPKGGRGGGGGASSSTRQQMSSSCSCSSPSTIWPWKNGAFDHNTSLLSSSPPNTTRRRRRRYYYNEYDEEEEDHIRNPSSSLLSSPATSNMKYGRGYDKDDTIILQGGGGPSPHTKLLLKDATDRITNDYMILLRASENGGTLPPLVVNSGLSKDNEPIIKRSRSWRVEALYDTNLQKVLDNMKIRQTEYHKKLEDAINKRKALLLNDDAYNDITSDRLNGILRQLNALSNKVEEASIMIEQRWKDRITWQRQKRQDAAIAKANRKKKLAFQKGGILNPNTSRLASVIEDNIIYNNNNIKDMIIPNNDYINTQSLLSLSDDHWSYFEQYLRIDNNNNNNITIPKMDIKKRKAALVNCLMDLHKRALNTIIRIGGCNEALLMLMEGEDDGNDNDDYSNNRGNKIIDEELYYNDDEEDDVLNKYCEVLTLASQRMHILLCIMKALTWEKRMRSLSPSSSSSSSSCIDNNTIVILKDIYHWFDIELEIARASSQEYSHLCVDHIHDLLTSIGNNNTYNTQGRKLLNDVESAASNYSHHLTALTQFLEYPTEAGAAGAADPPPPAPIGDDGLPLLWLLHELEQFKINSTIKIKEHMGEDIKRACALVRLILLLIPSGEYRYNNNTILLSSINNNKGTPSTISNPHSGNLLIQEDNNNNKVYNNKDDDDDDEDKENSIDNNNIMIIS